MKKEFQKPILKQYALRLNENIAASWEYYFSKGTYVETYSFTYVDPNHIHDPGTNLDGCFDYLTDNMAWKTALYEETGLPNVAMFMSRFLLDAFLIPLYEKNPSSSYITNCYHADNTGFSPTPSS